MTEIEFIEKFSQNEGSVNFKKRIFIQGAIDNLGVDISAAHVLLDKYCESVQWGIYALKYRVSSESVTNDAPPIVKVSFDNKISNKDLVNANSHLVPVPLDTFVKTSLYNDISAVIEHKIFAPIYITGPSGIGKSMSAIESCARHNVPLIRLSCTKFTNEETLIGSKTLKDGNIEIVEGPVLKAMRGGFTVLLEELDAASPNDIMCLQNILEGGSYYYSSIDENIKPAPGFNLIATGNTKGKGSSDGRFVGTQIQNEAFLDRFSFTFEATYPEEKEENKILQEYSKSIGLKDDQFIKELVSWANGIRKSFESGALDEIISTRRLKHILCAYLIFKKKVKAVELGVSRFDAITKSSFISLFKKVCADA
jgi:midasin (ATPase involved in ribosome maturation)